jgi:hypothetical protein
MGHPPDAFTKADPGEAQRQGTGSGKESGEKPVGAP